MYKCKKIKKIVFILLILCAFTLSGCKKKQVGAEEDNAIVTEKPEEEKQLYKFGFSCIAKENPYYVTLGDSIREALMEEGHTIIGLNKDTNLDPQLQITQIQEMIEEGIDAIFLSPVDWQAITPALEALHEAGVKIINLDTQVAAMDYVDAYIGSDNKNAGVQCGENLIQRFPNGGKIAILECPTMNSINERISGFEETISGHAFEVVARGSCNHDYVHSWLISPFRLISLLYQNRRGIARTKLLTTYEKKIKWKLRTCKNEKSGANKCINVRKLKK